VASGLIVLCWVFTASVDDWSEVFCSDSADFWFSELCIVAYSVAISF